MALKTAGEKTMNKDTSAPASNGTAGTTVLELALYKLYTWGRVTYEQGKPYRFRNADAMILLAEQDLGRPVWKLYRPIRVKEAPKNEIVDATMIHAPEPIDEFGSPLVLSEEGKDKKRRIDIGTDDEIADILDAVRGSEPSGDDVTV